MTKKRASADQAAPAAPATAEQQDNLPAGSIQDDVQPATETATAIEQPALGDAPVGDSEDIGDGEVEGLWIASIHEHGFRRCGFRFTREGVGIALAALTEEQIEQLESEPNLLVERGFFSGLVG